MGEKALVMKSEEIINQLCDVIGSDAVITDVKEREYFSMDVFDIDQVADIVIQPRSKDEISNALKVLSETNYQIIPRGGGMSYTGGYTPSTKRSVIIDTSLLNQIIEINSDDMYITVEAGCTWKKIYEALKPMGLRLPFFGTNSGSMATVGGGLSNGALFFGTGKYGSAADNVLGMEIIIADGTLIKTGQNAFANAKPHHRTYGPDTTGLFCHDAGSLGIKVQATFPLIYWPKSLGYLSFSYRSLEDAVAALSSISKSGLTEECYVLDPKSAGSLTDVSNVEGARSVIKVLKEQSSLIRGLKESVKMAFTGRNVIPENSYSLHMVISNHSQSALRFDIQEAEVIAERHNGQSIPNSIPKATRADPFPPMNGILGHAGERWAALNAKVPHTDALSVNQEIIRLMDQYKERMDACGVWYTLLNIGIQQHSYSIEPVLRWLDEWPELHKRTAEPSFLSTFEEPSPNIEARELVHEIRKEIIGYFASIGAASNQIGRAYDYMGYLYKPSKELLMNIKNNLDPKNKMNTGALGISDDF